jgi:hypothetical protein
MPRKPGKSKVVSVDVKFVIRFRVKEGSNLDDLDDAIGSLSMLGPPNSGIIDAVVDDWEESEKPPKRARKRQSSKEDLGPCIL